MSDSSENPTWRFLENSFVKLYKVIGLKHPGTGIFKCSIVIGEKIMKGDQVDSLGKSWDRILFNRVQACINAVNDAILQSESGEVCMQYGELCSLLTHLKTYILQNSDPDFNFITSKKTKDAKNLYITFLWTMITPYFKNEKNDSNEES